MMHGQKNIKSFYCVPMHKENMCTHYFLVKKLKPSTVLFVRTVFGYKNQSFYAV